MKIQLSNDPNHHVNVFVRHDQPAERGLFPKKVNGTHYDCVTLPQTHVIVQGDTCNCAGHAYCSPPDHFNKRLGTKTALRRALSQTTLTKPERTVIWKRILNLKEPANGPQC